MRLANWLLFFAVSNFHLIINFIYLASPPSGVHLGHMCLWLLHNGVGTPPFPVLPSFLKERPHWLLPWAILTISANQTTEDKTASSPLTCPLCVLLGPWESQDTREKVMSYIMSHHGWPACQAGRWLNGQSPFNRFFLLEDKASEIVLNPQQKNLSWKIRKNCMKLKMAMTMANGRDVARGQGHQGFPAWPLLEIPRTEQTTTCSPGLGSGVPRGGSMDKMTHPFDVRVP